MTEGSSTESGARSVPGDPTATHSTEKPLLPSTAPDPPPPVSDRLPLTATVSTPVVSVRTDELIDNCFSSAGVEPQSQPSNGVRPQSLPSRPPLNRSQSAAQRVENFFASTPTEEERAMQLARRLRHVARRGGVIPEKFREIKASFNATVTPASTPDVENPNISGFNFPSRVGSDVSPARPNTLDLSNPDRKRDSPPKVVPKDTGITVKDALAIAEAYGIPALSLITSTTARKFDIPTVRISSPGQSDLFFDYKKSKMAENGELQQASVLSKGQPSTSASRPAGRQVPAINDQPGSSRQAGPPQVFISDQPCSSRQAGSQVQYIDCQPSTSSGHTSNNSVIPKVFVTTAEVHQPPRPPPPSIEISDEHGNNISADQNGVVPEDYSDSPAAWTKTKNIPAAIRRKTSMKRQNAVGSEKKAIKRYVQRRLTKRLVTKESLDDAEDPPGSSNAPASPPSDSSSAALQLGMETRQVPVEDAKVSYKAANPENHQIDVESVPRLRVRKRQRPRPSSRLIDEEITLASPRRETPKRRGACRCLYNGIRWILAVIISHICKLFGVMVNVQEALVVNKKRFRIYTSQGALHSEDFAKEANDKDSTETEEQPKDLITLCADDAVDYRPFFSQWITCTQALVLILALFFYGFGPFAFSRVETTKFVPHVSGSHRLITVFEHPNLWIGPGFPSLIHAGAKYTPCMRRDKKIFQQIDEERIAERQTGCCIMNDRSGCFQTSPESGECSPAFAVMHNWNKTGTGFRNRKSGPVCGLDPRVCRDPPYQEAFWPDDVSQWPICHKTGSVEGIPHMKCEVTGRPCCIQSQGQCRITTRDYCEFVDGHYHEEATLCSQVNCLQDVCGMLPFYRSDSPNQIFRLLTPMFIHAGILGLLWTMFFQLVFMVGLEKMLGWKKVAIIYMVSGLGGYLASAVFVPFMPEVGPAASQGGILGALVVDGYYHWDLTSDKFKQIQNLFIVIMIFLVIGFLPWADNYAQWFGFIYGILVSIIVLPPVNNVVEQGNRRCPSPHRILALVIASTLLALLTGVLLAMFFWEPFEIPSYFQYFNCFPFIELLTEYACDNKGLQLKNWLPI